ncbi:MAG: hypothetical protein CL758_02570 [Chloroflexi bacterium]|nr:hypothetical protein [Chloroflexota bacterium]|tara:strand:+ start:298 stop:483 length:186 start_codon:yes stop_codon:yes gene_type:complete
MRFNFGIDKGLTRRQFMKGLPLGLLSAIAAGIVSRRIFGSSDKERYSKSLPKGSIYTPKDS